MSKIITKNNCVFCSRAKALLDLKDYEYEEVLLDRDITLEQFREMLPDAKTFPQIWLTVSGSEVYIGGYDKLVEYFDNNAE